MTPPDDRPGEPAPGQEPAPRAVEPCGETFRRLFETSPESITLVSADGAILDCNAATEKLAGLTRKQLVGRTLGELDAIDQAEVPAYLDMLRRLLDGEPVGPIDIKVLRPDGEECRLEAFPTVVSTEGLPPAILVVARDVTERREAEQALVEHQRLLGDVLDAVQAGISVLDRDLNVARVNAWMEQAYAAAMPLVGRKCYEAYQELEAPCPWCPSLRAIESGRPHEAVVPLPSLGHRTGGWAELTAYPLLAPDGEVLGVIEHIKDITKQKRAEDALRREHAFSSAIVETIGALVVVLDIEGRIVLFNRACEQATGYTCEETRGKPFWNLLLLAEEADAVRQVFAQLKAGHFPNRYENHWVSKRGERRLIAWSNTALLDDQGAVEYVIGTGIDITERRALEGQLRQAQKMEAIGRLAGGVAHDFNNLLTAICGYTELALTALSSRDPLALDLHEVRRAAQRAAALVRQLLAFSRRQVLQPTVLDLNAIITAMERMLRRIIGEHIALVVDLEPDLHPVEADPSQLEQVVLNLALNARDAMPDGGTLTLQTANVQLDDRAARQQLDLEAGPHVLLAVADTGTGMDDETLARIFEPFYTTKPPGIGSGLGLATVYGIVRQSGGYITCDSTPTHGTTARVYLPSLPDHPRPEPEPLPPDAAPRGAETILLVEDDDAVRSAARAMLQRSGYTVLEARSAGDALLIGERHDGPIHLLITDVIMPVVGGRELAQRLAKRRPDTHVLYISGYPDGITARNGALEPGAAFLQKPFTHDTLARKVRKVLGQPPDPPTTDGDPS